MEYLLWDNVLPSALQSVFPIMYLYSVRVGAMSIYFLLLELHPDLSVADMSIKLHPGYLQVTTPPV